MKFKNLSQTLKNRQSLKLIRFTVKQVYSEMRVMKLC